MHAMHTVKPPKRGQFGTGGFVLSLEVVLSKRSTILYHIFLHKCSHTGYYYIKSQRTELETEQTPILILRQRCVAVARSYSATSGNKLGVKLLPTTVTWQY